MAINKSWLVKISIIVVAYYTVAQLGLLLAFEDTNASPVWPPTGLALAAVLLWSYRIWPGIFIGAFLANAITFIWNGIPVTVSILMSCSIGMGNTLEAIIGAYLIYRFVGSDDPFLQLQDVLKFIVFAAILATTFGATVGVAGICIGGITSWYDFGYIWWTWWVGDAMGALVVTPLLFAWFKGRPVDWKLRQSLLAFLVFALLLGVLFITFGIPGRPTFALFHRLEYLIIPIIVLSTFLFGRLGATNSILITSITSVLFTVNGYGPFTMELSNESLLLLQIYLAVLVVMSLLLTGILAERRQTNERIIEINKSLELRVRERTEQLSEKNVELTKEITWRKKVEEQIKASLKEKEVLLKEIHHRVKNNMQIMASLLRLQSEGIEDKHLLDLFNESRNRIKSMALIHEDLYSGKDLARIDFDQYTRKLTGRLISAYGVNPNRIITSVNIDNVFFGVDTAIPCGLILNELFTNSLKYAFPHIKTDVEHIPGKDEDRERSKNKGEVRIDCHSNSDEYTLVFSDNGVGLPEDVDFQKTEHWAWIW